MVVDARGRIVGVCQLVDVAKTRQHTVMQKAGRGHTVASSSE